MRKKSPKHQSDTWVRESISCLCVWICGGTRRHTPVQANQEVRAGFDIDECHPLLSVLSVLEAQRKLSTAFLFSRKNLISIQHASPAHCIQSRALTIQSEHLWLCVCIKSVCDDGRLAETGRENPFVLPVNAQGHVWTHLRRAPRGNNDIPGQSVWFVCLLAVR